MSAAADANLPLLVPEVRSSVMYPRPPQKHYLGAEHLSALEVLADAGLWGCSVATLLAYGFPINMLASLVRDGFATCRHETLRMNNRKIRTARIWITDIGRSTFDEAVRQF